MAKDAVVIRGLERRFPSFRLGPLDMTVPAGAIYGLIGPNGAGKTTTLDLLLGMGAKDAGTIEVFGLDHVRDEVAVKRRIGYVGPDLSHTAWGRVDRLIGFVRGFYPDWDDTYCADLLDRLNIGRHDRISTLSFGARTKLSLVLALAHRPDLLLLDEPLAGLDVLSKQEVFAELLRAVQSEERTVVISSHDLHDLERLTDHTGFLHRGQMLLEGPTAEIVERFRMLDCVLPESAAPDTVPGVRVLGRQGDRWRLLADRRAGAPAGILSAGAAEVAESPVTLEELFVGLTREARHENHPA